MRDRDDIIFDQKAGRQRGAGKNKLRARCPACSAWVPLRDAVEVWDLVSCPECDTLLEVTDLRPPTLDYEDSGVDDDDWEDDDWEQ